MAWKIERVEAQQGKDTKARKARCHFFVVKENVLENLQRRRARPYEEWRPLVERALAEAGIPSTLVLTRPAWRQNAGCACGCSPAFVFEVPWHLSGLEVFVDVSET